jgi:hypothetical protein
MAELASKEKKKIQRLHAEIKYRDCLFCKDFQRESFGRLGPLVAIRRGCCGGKSAREPRWSPPGLRPGGSSKALPWAFAPQTPCSETLKNTA